MARKGEGNLPAADIPEESRDANLKAHTVAVRIQRDLKELRRLDVAALPKTVSQHVDSYVNKLRKKLHMREGNLGDPRKKL